MPQTISLQRGTTSIVANGTNSVTLFTNSASGIATRVILNQLVWQNASVSSNNSTFVLFHRSSGGYDSIIGFIRTSQGNTYQSGQFNPGNTMPVMNQVGTVSVNMPMASFMTTMNASTMSSDSTQNLNISVPSSSTVQNMMPNNFWIGPSDSLFIKSNFINNDSGQTATLSVGYSFTLITES